MFLKGSLQHFEVVVKTTSGFTDSSLFFFWFFFFFSTICFVLQCLWSYFCSMRPMAF